MGLALEILQRKLISQPLLLYLPSSVQIFSIMTITHPRIRSNYFHYGFYLSIINRASWPSSAAVRGKVGSLPQDAGGYRSSEENALPRHFEQHPTDYLAYSVFLEDLKGIIDEELQRQAAPIREGIKRIEEHTKVVKDDIAENQGRSRKF
jgi:hypothetical protein